MLYIFITLSFTHAKYYKVSARKMLVFVQTNVKTKCFCKIFLYKVCVFSEKYLPLHPLLRTNAS